MRAAAAAGMFAPAWFVALVVLQGVMNPNYSHVALPISALAAFETGWIQTLNFCVVGALMAMLTVALHHAINPAGFVGLLGVAMLLLSSAGLVAAALFPWVIVDGVPRETPEHVVGAIMTFVGASTGFIGLSRRIRADAAWSDLGGYVFTTGCTMLALFVVLGAFAIDEGAPLHAWAGLLQRVVVVVWFSCVAVLSLRLWRIARDASSRVLEGHRASTSTPARPT